MLFNRACTQKAGFFANSTFSVNFILIVFRHSKNKKKYPRHEIDVKSILTVGRPYIHRFSSRNPHFSAYFLFHGFPLFFTPILSSDLDSTKNFTRDVVP